MEEIVPTRMNYKLDFKGKKKPFFGNCDQLATDNESR
jgi:hypothetical protein